MNIHDKRFAAETSERMAYHKTCLTIRPGSSTVFIGVDVGDRYSAIDAMVSPGTARDIAAHLIKLADDVDAEIASDNAPISDDFLNAE